jgi:hypothetical protein
MIYLGVGKVYGDTISPNVIRWKNDIDFANYGTYGYIVRHKSIPRILDTLTMMSAPIDVQYYLLLGKLNIYIVQPLLIKPNDAFESSIDIQGKRE